jgi:hypothetical protein
MEKIGQLRKERNAPIAFWNPLASRPINEGTHRSPPLRRSADTSEHKSFAANRT